MYKRDDAVSPVIGVILMVAITVILAAVIAAFVFGMAGNVQKTKTVAFTCERDSASTTGVVITNHGGKDAGDINQVDVTLEGDLNSDVDLTVIGSSQRFGDTTIAGKKAKVVVTVTFNDGTKQVVVDTQV
jgi:flagellin-like protein